MENLYMIRLKDLLSIEGSETDVGTDASAHENGTIWWIQASGHYGAKNNSGNVRYFVNRDDATAFTRARDRPGAAAQYPERKEPVEYKQKYDLRND